MRYSNELPSCDQLLALYADAGCSSYTADPGKLLRAISSSLLVATAWEGEQLVGLARAVGDRETILYIQDVLVLSSFQHAGVGSQLMAMLLSAYPEVRHCVLMSDDSPAAAELYHSMGFHRADDQGFTAYVRFT